MRPLKMCLLGILLAVPSTTVGGVEEIDKPNFEAREWGKEELRSPSIKGPSCSAEAREINKVIEAVHGRRALVVENQTGRAIRVFVAYRTRYQDGTWEWRNRDFDSFWTFGPGDIAHPTHGESTDGKPWRINADKILIWARSSDGQWEWTRDKASELTIGAGSPDQGVIGNYTYTFK